MCSSLQHVAFICTSIVFIMKCCEMENIFSFRHLYFCIYLFIYYCNKNEDIKLSVHISGITLIIIAIFINFSEKNC